VQYQAFIAGKKSTMTQERVDRLEGIGFKWRLLQTWEEKFDQIKKFYVENGHLQVTDKNLKVWATEQRRQYRFRMNGKESCMTQDRIDKLNSIGFSWEPAKQRSELPPGERPLSEQFMKRIKELQEFYRQNGHSRVPYDYPPNEELGKWCSKQRTEYKNWKSGIRKSKMNQRKCDLLEELDFSWKRNRWDNRRIEGATDITSTANVPGVPGIPGITGPSVPI